MIHERTPKPSEYVLISATEVKISEREKELLLRK